MTDNMTKALEAVMVKSVAVSRADHPVVAGPDFVSLIERGQEANLFSAVPSSTSSPDASIVSQQPAMMTQLRNAALVAAVDSLGTIGFQATNLARAAQEILMMVHGRRRCEPSSSDEGADPPRTHANTWIVDDDLFSGGKPKPFTADADDNADDQAAADGMPPHCTIFVGCTANIFATGVRHSLATLASRRLFDVLVVSGGAFELDLQHALDPASFVVGGFDGGAGSAATPVASVTYGNVTVAPSDRYTAWMREHIPKVLFEGAGRVRDDVDEDKDNHDDHPHRRHASVLSPNQFWTRLARLLPPEARAASVLSQCVANGIAVYSPSLADGSVRELLRPFVVVQGSDNSNNGSATANKPFVLDLTRDITRINKAAVRAKRSGMIVLGGGVVKHHVCNANLMRNGADHSVFVNSAQEFDGSDAGARPDEAVSWGKIRQGASAVKVYAEVSSVFGLLSAMTFGEVLIREKLRSN